LKRKRKPSPSPIAEYFRRLPKYAKRYAKPLSLLEEACLPAGTDKLRLAQKMLDALKDCQDADNPHRPHDFLDMARDIGKDAKGAARDARELARFLRRYERFPRLSSTIGQAALSASLEGGHFSDILRFAEMLDRLAESLPELPLRGDSHQTRYGIRYEDSLLRKGLPPDPITACLFAMVWHARQATGPARDAWLREDWNEIGRAMPKDGQPLHGVAAAFVSAADFKGAEGELAAQLDAKKVADRLATFMRRNPGAEYRGFRILHDWPE